MCDHWGEFGTRQKVTMSRQKKEDKCIELLNDIWTTEEDVANIIVNFSAMTHEWYRKAIILEKTKNIE